MLLNFSFVLIGKMTLKICKLNPVLNSIYVSWLFEVVSVTVALCIKHLVRHLPLNGQGFGAVVVVVVVVLVVVVFLLFFFLGGGGGGKGEGGPDSYIVCYLEYQRDNPLN